MSVTTIGLVAYEPSCIGLCREEDWVLKKKKVAVLMVGVNRSLTFTWSSINREIIEPIRQARNWELETYAHFIRPSDHQINNPRSGELGFIERILPGDLQKWTLVETADGLVSDHELDASFFFELPWHYDSKTIDNHYRYLSALEQSFERFISHKRFDAVVVCRPDLLIAPGLEIVRNLKLLGLVSMIFRDVAIVPSWQDWGGVNDRFALLNERSAQKYLTRIRQSGQLALAGATLNSETYLRNALRGTLILSRIPTQMIRVRLGNRFEKTDLDYFYGETYVCPYPVCSA